MRAAILVMAVLTLPALAQQAPDDPLTVPQPQFGTGVEAQSAAAGQPRFVPAPGQGGIEVTPLPPPVGAAGATVTAPPGQDVPLGEPGAEGTGTAAGVGTVREGTQDGEPTGGPLFRSAPRQEEALARPSSQAVPLDSPSTDLRQGVRLRELDKMTGQTETFELAVGETRQVDRLQIRLEACRSPETNDTHGTVAFLKVWDVRKPEDEAFSGWMFAESPSLSALDHPRYDLWVISCTTSAVAESSASE
jgi:hypothetical protein